VRFTSPLLLCLMFWGNDGVRKRNLTDGTDFFLHPGLSPGAIAGRGVVNATVNMIQGFRKAGMKVLWTNVCPLSPRSSVY
jgi:nicotinamidase-related amidase